MDFFLFEETSGNKSVQPATAHIHAQRAIRSLARQLPFLRKLRAYWEAEAPEQFRTGVQVVGYEDHRLILRCGSATQAAALRRQSSSICAELRARHKNLRYLKAIKVRSHPHYAASESAAPSPRPALSSEVQSIVLEASQRAQSASLRRALAAFAVRDEPPS